VNANDDDQELLTHLLVALADTVRRLALVAFDGVSSEDKVKIAEIADIHARAASVVSIARDDGGAFFDRLRRQLDPAGEKADALRPFLTNHLSVDEE
jgi:hypothetical protein